MSKTIRILTGQGIGDSIWCMPKVQSIAKAFGADRIEMLCAAWEPIGIQDRGLSVLERFSFIDSARMHVMPQQSYGPTLLPGWPTDEEGHYRYIPDGVYLQEWANGLVGTVGEDGSYDFVAIPNRALERGIRLEDWLPEYETNWKAFEEFSIPGDDWTRATVGCDYYPFIAFFMSSAESNGIGSDCGHNRGPLWKPEEWAALGDYLIEKHGVNIVVVGAEYDSSYYRRFVKLHIKHPDKWQDCLGKWPVMTTYAILKQAKCLVGFQSGIPIVAHYLGVPTAIWWRPGDNSILGSFDLRCDERMSHCWTYPGAVESGQYLPMIYTRTTMDEIKEWCARWI